MLEKLNSNIDKDTHLNIKRILAIEDSIEGLEVCIFILLFFFFFFETHVFVLDDSVPNWQEVNERRIGDRQNHS